MTIFNIQKFCTNDGPGIRTTVFMKGCPLRCDWCHNPESHSKKKELAFDAGKCTFCGGCAEVCPEGCHTVENGKHTFRREVCIACGRCTETACGALEVFGREESTEDILREVMKDKLFYDNSGGGITLSGGEPFAQGEACLELLKAAKETGLHICMETCGHAPKELVEESARYVDIYLFDYKETDPEKHKSFTGVDNSLILSNLRMLDSLGKSIILRCPIIPGYNSREEHFKGIGELANSLENIIRIDIEPYHPLGENKYHRFDRDYAPSGLGIPEEEVVAEWMEQVKKYTSVEVKKG